MNDDALLTAVRETVADVRRTTPLEQIVSRGHAVRARRRLPAWQRRWPSRPGRQSP